MTNRYEQLTDDHIKYVIQWANRCGVGGIFTFSGWKSFHAEYPEAPKATKIGGQVVAALERTPADPRLDFIGLAEGPGKCGEIGDKKGDNAQYYVRLK